MHNTYANRIYKIINSIFGERYIWGWVIHIYVIYKIIDSKNTQQTHDTNSIVLSEI